jgi:hypothetical protein
MNSESCNVHGQALALCCHLPYPDFVRISWSETRSYSAVIPIGDLAAVVREPGEVDDGTPGSAGRELPASLSQLEGDPWKSGNLNGLLCDLEPDALADVDGITVESVQAAEGPAPSVLPVTHP